MDKVLVTYKIPEMGIKALKEHFDVYVNTDEEALSREWLKQNINKYFGILSMLHDRIDKEIIDAAGDGLKIISNYAVGYNNIDVKYASEKGITVANTPGILTIATAELAFSLMLAVMRKIAVSDRYVRDGRFKMWYPELMLGDELTGKKVGIVGMGRIGQAFAKMLRGFDVQISYYNRNRVSPETEKELNASYKDFDTLVSESDIISIHAPLNDDTHHLFKYETFKAMKNEAYIINTGRGAIIREKDLAQALKEGLIKGAGIDVYEYEPVVEKELLELENIVMTPHTGSGSYKARYTMSTMAAQAIIDCHKGKKPDHVVKG